MLDLPAAGDDGGSLSAVETWERCNLSVRHHKSGGITSLIRLGGAKKTQKKANNKTNGIEQTYWIINLSWTNSLVSVSQPAAEDSSAAWPEALSHGDTANLHLRGGGSVVLCSPHWMTDVCSLRYNSFKEKYQTL